jgi:hypothetical protein
VNSEKIPNTKETLKNVIDYYQGLTRLLDSKNESKITEIFLEKSSEMGKALGYSTEVMFEEIEILGAALKANNDNSGWVRKDPEWEKAELEFAMDAKLVRLVAPPYGPAIYYENDDLYNSFEIWLRKDGDKFVISR